MGWVVLFSWKPRFFPLHVKKLNGTTVPMAASHGVDVHGPGCLGGRLKQRSGAWTQELNNRVREGLPVRKSRRKG